MTSRSTGEELCQLQKALNEFTFDVTQLQSQLDSVHREKSVLQSKQIEMERMHIQMKEAMSADIDYLRKLNLQLVEQHMKGIELYCVHILSSHPLRSHACVLYAADAPWSN